MGSKKWEVRKNLTLFFLLPTSYSLLPTLHFLLPTPYSLLPTSQQQPRITRLGKGGRRGLGLGFGGGFGLRGGGLGGGAIVEADEEIDEGFPLALVEAVEGGAIRAGWLRLELTGKGVLLRIDRLINPQIIRKGELPIEAEKGRSPFEPLVVMEEAKNECIFRLGYAILLIVVF